MRTRFEFVCACLLLIGINDGFAAEPDRAAVLASMKRAATYFRTRVAVHGGYVYHYSEDLKNRWGEGVATAEQIWVQPPGTPSVGMAYLTAWQATQDRWYLDAAIETARALTYGQLKSGGWTNQIDFAPDSPQAGAYRNGKGRDKGRNLSTLDDDITQSALRFLMHLDQALEFKDPEIHSAVEVALKAMLAAQFPNGGFPQVWDKPVEARPVIKASFPDYDWRTEHRVKDYWAMYTLNDQIPGHVTDTLLVAQRIYPDSGAKDALRKLGDFLIVAQMPDPQPAWAQQYDPAMHPVWARKFEPPAITGGESQDAIEVLLTVHQQTGDAKYLEPIPRAIEYFKKSLLPDGRLARFYELKSNRPLYMNQKYELTYDDSDVPTHYSWKINSRLDQLERRYLAARKNSLSRPGVKADKPRGPDDNTVKQIVGSLDEQGRWLSINDGNRLPGQAKIRKGDKYLSSQVFCDNLNVLSLAVKQVGVAK